MPPRKRAPKMEATPAPLPPEKKPATARARKADAAAQPKRAVAKVTGAAESKAPKAKAVRPKAPKAAQPPQEEAPVVVETSVAPEAPAQPARPAISMDDVRRAAFLLSQRRRGPSDPFADWLEAERMLGAHSS